MKPKCENDICNKDALFEISGVLCCGNHTSWAARKALEINKDGAKIAWAPEEAA